jgi:ferrous iron transport protein B
VLGIPEEVGTPLIFGIFRKELSLLMLAQAFGTTNFTKVLTSEQMIIYTVFVVFYIPCLATMITIKNELGWKNMGLISGLSIFVALIAALFLRLVFLVF